MLTLSEQKLNNFFLQQAINELSKLTLGRLEEMQKSEIHQIACHAEYWIEGAKCRWDNEIEAIIKV